MEGLQRDLMSGGNLQHLPDGSLNRDQGEGGLRRATADDDVCCKTNCDGCYGGQTPDVFLATISCLTLSQRAGYPEGYYSCPNGEGGAPDTDLPLKLKDGFTFNKQWKVKRVAGVTPCTWLAREEGIAFDGRATYGAFVRITRHHDLTTLVEAGFSLDDVDWYYVFRREINGPPLNCAVKLILQNFFRIPCERFPEGPLFIYHPYGYGGLITIEGCAVEPVTEPAYVLKWVRDYRQIFDVGAGWLPKDSLPVYAEEAYKVSQSSGWGLLTVLTSEGLPWQYIYVWRNVGGDAVECDPPPDPNPPADQTVVNFKCQYTYSRRYNKVGGWAARTGPIIKTVLASDCAASTTRWVKVGTDDDGCDYQWINCSNRPSDGPCPETDPAGDPPEPDDPPDDCGAVCIDCPEDGIVCPSQRKIVISGGTLIDGAYVVDRSGDTTTYLLPDVASIFCDGGVGYHVKVQNEDGLTLEVVGGFGTAPGCCPPASGYTTIITNDVGGTPVVTVEDV